MKKLIIMTAILVGLITTAQAGSLGDETKKYLSQGYEITASGVLGTERGFAGTYFVMMKNTDADHPFIICEKRYDSDKTKCYSL